MSQSFTPQVGWKKFKNKYDNFHFKQLIELLHNEKYEDAIKYTVNNPDIINKSDRYGWTPLMALIANIQDIKCLPYIQSVIGFVNLKQINLEDNNYLLIAIKHCHPEILFEVYKILIEHNINIHYINHDNINAFDLAIDMFKFTIGKNCDIKYFSIAFDLKEKHRVQSIKYEIINHIEFPISPWLIENLENDSDYYEVVYDPNVLCSNLVSIHPVPNSNVCLTFEKQSLTIEDIKRRKEMTDIMNIMSDEELLVQLKMSLGQNINSNHNTQYSKRNVPFLSSYSNELKKKDLIKNVEKPETYKEPKTNPNNDNKSINNNYQNKKSNLPTQNIIIFDKSLTQTQLNATCIRCGIKFTDKNYVVIFKPCDHAIMCKGCIIKLNKKRSINGCPKCYTKIHYAVLN
jgi:hypothetical protein